jgi:hypothetical protein
MAMNLERMIADLRKEREELERTVLSLRGVLGSDSGPLKPLSSTQDNRTKRAEILEEYKFLRVELDKIWEQTYTTMNFMFVAIGLCISAGLSQYGEPLIMLPCASVLTFGGYNLIRIHPTRVWRIVGYMRCALETNLEGIRWETRLAARNKVLESKNPDLDRDIFDGQVLILNLVNGIILLLLTAFGALSLAEIHFASANAHLLDSVHEFWPKVFCSLFAMLLPTLILVWALRTQSRYKRGNRVEKDHLQSWKEPCLEHNSIVAEA